MSCYEFPSQLLKYLVSSDLSQPVVTKMLLAMQSLHTAGEPQNTSWIAFSRISFEIIRRQLEGTELVRRSLVN